MRKEILADLCSELYYNGKQSNDKTLDKQDFIQLIDAARGQLILRSYWAARNASLDIEESGFLSSYMEEFPVNVTNGKKGHELLLPQGVVSLPHGYGVLELSTDAGDCECEFIRIDAGAGWQICGDNAETFYEPLGNKIRLYNVPECIKTVNVMMVPAVSENVPTDIVFDVINNIFGLVLKIKGFPIDAQDDGNPNTMVVNKKLAEAQMQ